MRFVGIALVLLSLPVFLALLGRGERARDWAVAGMGLLMFMVSSLQVDAALISWRGWPGTSKGIVISPVDMLAIALIATRPARLTAIPFAAASLIWLIPTTVSMAVAETPMASFFKVAEGLQLILFATAIAGELVRHSALLRLFQGLSVGLIVQAGFVVEQKLSGIVQATGSLSHQNSLGMMVELSVLPLIGYVLEGGKSKLVVAGIVAGLLAVAGGGSRGTLLFLAIGIILLVAFSLSRGMTSRKAKLLAIGVAGAVVVVPLAFATLEDRFGDKAMVTEEAERAAFERAAIAMADDHPLGVGANHFITTANMGGYYAAAEVNWNATSRAAAVHNVYLLTRAETGRFGEIMLYVLIGLCAWYGLVAGRRARAPLIGGAALGTSAAAIAVMAHNHFEYVFSLGVIQRLFWLNLAIVAACLAVEKQANAAARRRRAMALRESAAAAGGAGPDSAALSRNPVAS